MSLLNTHNDIIKENMDEQLITILSADKLRNLTKSS